jgi:hypothetical protein
MEVAPLPLSSVCHAGRKGKSDQRAIVSQIRFDSTTFRLSGFALSLNERTEGTERRRRQKRTHRDAAKIAKTNPNNALF